MQDGIAKRDLHFLPKEREYVHTLSPPYVPLTPEPYFTLANTRTLFDHRKAAIQRLKARHGPILIR